MNCITKCIEEGNLQCAACLSEGNLTPEQKEDLTEAILRKGIIPKEVIQEIDKMTSEPTSI